MAPQAPKHPTLPIPGVPPVPAPVKNGIIGGVLGPASLLPGSGVLTDLPGFLSALTQRNTWLRVGEGFLGLILIGIGVFAITRSQPIGKAAIKTASTVGKVAAL
jgi:hypothetical protein